MTTRKRYPTDLSDKQWAQLQVLLPQKRTPAVKQREYINGILYILRTGCSWRMMPHDLPNWSTVKTYFHKLRRDGTWERINDALREKMRQESGHEAEPSVLIVDSQSVKTTEKGRNYDGGKKIKGTQTAYRGRYTRLVRVLVHLANGSDKDSAKHLLRRVPLFSRWQKVLFDAGYDSPALLHWRFR